MSDLGWRADGIARALANGGVVLEKYHRPGFTGGPDVRRLRPREDGGGSWFVTDCPPPESDDEDRR